LSYVKSLRTVLKGKHKGLFNRLSEIEDLAKSILIYTVSKFPYYTPHSFKHSLNVEENLNWLVPDGKKMDLNSYEIFFLLISSWLHDWGMVGIASEDPKEIRENHHLRTEENFEKLYDKIHVSLNEARIIGRICRGHRCEDLLDAEFDDLFFRSNIRIRTRFLSALLRIADECDVTENRVPQIIYYSLNPKGASDEEFRKHLSIIGIGQPEPYKLQLSGVARDPRSVKVLEGVRKKIQNELNRVKTILAKENIVLEYVELKVDTRGFINKPIEFALDREKIVNLLIGENLYHRFDVGIRELLQNSIDACRLRNSLEKGYSPLVVFSFNKEKISVEDNGIGMSFDTASRYLSKIGESFFVSKEFEDLKGGKILFDPISRFGIGILSCFLIAHKVIIETMKENEEPCKFIIEDLAEGWRYEAGSKRTVGTKISMLLNEKGKELNLQKALQHYAKAVDLPIQIINEDTGKKEFLQQQWDHRIDEIKEVFEEREVFGKEKLPKPTFSKTIKTNGIEAKYYYYKEPWLFPYMRAIYFFSYHGLYVGRIEVCHCTGEGCIVLVNCTKNLVDLAVSRERFVENEKFYDFVKLLYENFFELIREYYIERTKNKKLSTFDNCNNFAQVCRRFFASGSVVPEKEHETMTSFLLERVYPVLDREGSHLLTGKSIFSRKDVQKIYEYRLKPKDCQYHIKSIGPLLREILEENHIVVLNMSPLVILSYDRKPREYLSVFQALCKNKNIKYAHLTLPGLLGRRIFNKISTPLDHLLPENSYFAKLPQQFRSSVVLSKRFDFGKESEIRPFYDILCIRELFSCDNEMYEQWDTHLKQQIKSYGLKSQYQKIAPAEFMFDFEDPVIGFMLKKSDLILSSKTLENTVERYFRYLALSTLEIDLDTVHYLSMLTTLEKTILSWLKYKGEYKPLQKRAGRLSTILSSPQFS